MKKRNGLLAVLGLFLLPAITFAQQSPIYINCGNSGSVTYNSITYAADQYYSGELTYSSSHVTNPQPFKSIRYTKTPTTGSHIMDYKIPVANGDYDVTLRFLEIYFGVSGSGGVGSRVFDVSIEGQLVEDDLDILAEVGQNNLYSPVHTVTVSDGELTIDFVASTGDPIISAIEVVEATSGGGTTGGYWTKTGNDISYADGDVKWGTSGATLKTDQGAAIELRGTQWPYIDFSNDPTTDYDMRILMNGSEDLGIVGGNVGIGTTHPGSEWRLDVVGKVRANEIKVEASGADYVFLKDYPLPTLEEVGRHIDEKGHLINVPSAAEVRAKGIELGQWNMKLLEKIEELTLYVLQQQQAIDDLRDKVSTLEKSK